MSSHIVLDYTTQSMSDSSSAIPRMYLSGSRARRFIPPAAPSSLVIGIDGGQACSSATTDGSGFRIPPVGSDCGFITAEPQDIVAADEDLAKIAAEAAVNPLLWPLESRAKRC